MRRALQLAASVISMLSASTVHAAMYALIVGGLGGEPEYEKQFRLQTDELAGAMKHLDEDAHVTSLSGEQATAAGLRHELNKTAELAADNDRVVLMLVGHGSFDGEEYRFNIPGPDITGSELAALLNRIKARDQLVVVATSASGGALARLQTHGNERRRIVITATKSGAERNATRFGEQWVRALTTKEADVDKDDWVTVREAYEYAERKVADAYKSQAALATEHARIDDGASLATRLPLARLGAAKIMPTDPELRQLIAERLRLERAVDAVKTRKEQLDDAQYYDELEKVLVDLARTQVRIDSRQAVLEQSAAGERKGGPKS